MAEKDNLKEAIEQTKLQMKVERIEQHHAKYSQNFDELFIFMQDFKVTLVRIENSIEKTADLPEKVRKLEDKSVVFDLIKIAIGIAIGAIITGYVSQNLAPIREKEGYNLEQTR